MPPSPNVLIFCVDEMRADHLRPMGNPVMRTPHLDRRTASCSTCGTIRMNYATCGMTLPTLACAPS